MIPRRRVPLHWRHISAFLADSSDADAAISSFENRFADFCRCPKAVAFPSGRSAMAAALSAFPSKGRKEVVIPAYTLQSLAPLVQSLGFDVVLADIDRHTLNVTAETLAPCLSDNTHAVIAADLFGNPCDASNIAHATALSGAYFLEDAAHAAGSELSGSAVGAHSDACFFSFDTIKPINAFGGGILVSKNRAFLKRARLLQPKEPGSLAPVIKRITDNAVERVVMATPAYGLAVRLLAAPLIGERLKNVYMANRDATVPAPDAGWLPAQAAIAEAALSELAETVGRQREIAAEIMAQLSGLIEFQEEMVDAKSNRYFLVGAADIPAEQARRRLLRYGIDAGAGSEITDFLALPDETARFPSACEAYERLIQLPCHAGLSDREVGRLIKRTRRALG